MNPQFNLKSRAVRWTFAFTFICFVMFSCKDTQDNIAETDQALLRVSTIQIAQDETKSSVGSKATSTINSSNKIDKISIPFSPSSTLDVTLTKISTTGSSSRMASGGQLKAVAQIDQTPLGKNIKYQLIIYNSQGDLVTQRTITNTPESTENIPLKAGQTYTFIAYSINSTANLPSVSAPAKLSDAKLSNINGDLMYFKTSKTLTSGQNSLDVILKHKYSQIVTNLKMDENMTGAITNIMNPILNPSHVNADLKLVDGIITYNGINQSGVNVIFPSLGNGLREISSSPTILIHPKETAGTLKFGSITIDGETKTNISVPNLNIVPGQRYDLNLNFRTCTESVNAKNISWTYPEMTVNGVVGANVNGTFRKNGTPVETTFTAPGADYGFVFDITKLDNSLNMAINNTVMASKEIQFQSNATSSAQNIRFKDGSLYGGVNVEGGTVPQIWKIIGTTNAPAIKIVIARDGKVTMFGSKISGGPLYELELFNGNTFNSFPWSNADTNTVKATQLVDGNTQIIATGSGKKKIACPR